MKMGYVNALRVPQENTGKICRRDMESLDSIGELDT